MAKVETKQTFIDSVSKFKQKYHIDKEMEIGVFAPLHSISQVYNGIKTNVKLSEDTISALLFDGVVDGCKVSVDSLRNINIEELDKERECCLLLKKDNLFNDRITVLYSSEKIIYSSDYFGITTSRYGFLAKYIYAILSSRYIFVKNGMYDKELSVTLVKNIIIPIISPTKQVAFSIVADYYMNSVYNSPASLFFRRLLDTMVYELYFKTTFDEVQIEIIKYTDDFAELPRNTDEIQMQIEQVYSKISNPNHMLSSNMLKVLSIDEVIKIENII